MVAIETLVPNHRATRFKNLEDSEFCLHNGEILKSRIK